MKKKHLHDYRSAYYANTNNTNTGLNITCVGCRLYVLKREKPAKYIQCAHCDVKMNYLGKMNELIVVSHQKILRSYSHIIGVIIDNCTLCEYEFKNDDFLVFCNGHENDKFICVKCPSCFRYVEKASKRHITEWEPQDIQTIRFLAPLLKYSEPHCADTGNFCVYSLDKDDLEDMK